MKLTQFNIDEKLELSEIRTIKAGCAESQSSGNFSKSAGADVECGDTEYDS